MLLKLIRQTNYDKQEQVNLVKVLTIIARLILKIRLVISTILIMIFALALVLNFYNNIETPFRLISNPLVLFLAFILALDFLIISPIKHNSNIIPTKVTVKTLLLLLVILSILTLGEVYFLGHTLFTPLALVASSWLYLTSKNTRGLSLVYLPLLLSLLIVAHYLVFPPSFGNDTLRDIMWSDETLKSGHYTESRITHTAYYFPMVVLLYTALSLAGGYSPTMASVVVGFLYLFALGIYLFLLLRKLYGQDQYSKTTALLLFSTPMIVIWSVGFIPQAMALLFVLLLLYLISRTDSVVAITLLSAAVVFTHPGVALFTIAYFAYMYFFSPDRERYRRPLLYIAALYIAYFTYTTVSHMVVPGLRLYLDTLLSILLGGNIAQRPTSPIELGLFNKIVPWIPLVVALTLGVNTILTCQPRDKTCAWSLLTVLFSAAALAAGYAITVLQPDSTADRYIGLPATTLLIIASLPGLKAFDVTSRLGRGFQYTLIGLLIFAFAFAGTLTPLNPLTANPNVYSVYGLLSYSDKAKTEVISELLSVDVPVHVYTDWRTGLMLLQFVLSEYSTTFQDQLSTSVIGKLELHLFGSYGYRYDRSLQFPDGSIILFRERSVDMFESWSQTPHFSYTAFSKVFDNNNFYVYLK